MSNGGNSEWREVATGSWFFGSRPAVATAPSAAPPPPPAPVSRRGMAVPVPKAAELVDVLAKHYRARPDTIIEWLRAIDWPRAEAA